MLKASPLANNGTKFAAALYAPGLIVTCALLVTLPFLTYGPSCGHDFDFHLQSWFAANADWRGWAAGAGSPLYPHWVSAANYGAGEPRFVFYPPLSWALGALLGMMLPWTWVAQAWTALVLAACGFAFHRLASRWVRADIAAGAACVYLCGPYLLFVALERTAYGELLAAVTMPLVMLYAVRARPAVTRLALAMAALWLTNAPAAVMGCYLLLLCALAAALAAGSVMPALRALAAMVLGTGVAAEFVLPAWYEQRWVEIGRVINPGMRVEDSFLFGHTGEPFHDQVLHTASWIAVEVLAVGVTCAALGWFALRSPKRPGKNALTEPVHSKRHCSMLGLLAATLVAILLLLLPVSEPVWRYAPELRFLQFPWRWLLVARLAATLAGAIFLDAAWTKWQHKQAAGAGHRSMLAGRAGLAALLCTGAGFAGHLGHSAYAQSCDEEDNVVAQQILLAPDNDAGFLLAPAAGQAPAAGFEGTDEYTPANADNGEIQQELPAVRLLLRADEDEGDDSVTPNPEWHPGLEAGGSVRIDSWGAERKRFLVTAPAARYAVLRLMDYPAWQVLANGRAPAERPHREDGLLTIPVAAGMTAIEVRYEATADVYAGRALSLVSLSVLAGWAAWSRRRRGNRRAPRAVPGPGQRGPGSLG